MRLYLYHFVHNRYEQEEDTRRMIVCAPVFAGGAGANRDTLRQLDT